MLLQKMTIILNLFEKASARNHIPLKRRVKGNPLSSSHSSREGEAARSVDLEILMTQRALFFDHSKQQKSSTFVVRMNEEGRYFNKGSLRRHGAITWILTKLFPEKIPI